MIEIDVMKYKNMIYKIIRKHGYKSKWLDAEDLFQEGCIGVVYAYNSYQKNDKATFNTWVYNCINWHILKALRGDIKAKGISFVSTNRPIQNDQEDTLEELIEDDTISISETVEDRLMYGFFMSEFERCLEGDDLKVMKYMYDNPGCSWWKAFGSVGIGRGRVASGRRRIINKLNESAYIRNKKMELYGEMYLRYYNNRYTSVEDKAISKERACNTSERMVIW